ncbi:MAG TPA: 2-dehydropantoate 2-reductase, partial [Casimicrobiaceae bacterium]|nr:2-dehydropantoate 2-reductase [Casimicrobiaceae bacterium]
ATDDPAQLGARDLVVIAVKAPALASVAEGIGPLLGPHTTALVAMNGVPWWFFDGFGERYAGTTLRSVDPEGRIAAAIPTRHVLGSVVHMSASVAEPGLVRHGMGRRLILGEPSGASTDRLRALTDLFTRAGFEIETSSSIQRDIWYKLWGNMTMNPLSALTGATADRILDDPLVRKFCIDAMAEAQEIGARIGCPIEQTGEERMVVTRKLGAFRTSMLQDVEAGRPIELDAIVAVVHELGKLTGVATPNIDALLGVTRVFARTRGLYS